MTTKRFNIHSDEDNETIWISDVQKHKEIEIQHYYGIATVVKMLNELHEENQSFEIHSKWQGEKYSELLDSFTNMKKKLQLVKKENEELKSIKTFAERNGINVFLIEEAFQKCWNDNGKLIKENEQLKSFNQDLSENLSVCADKRLAQGEHLTKLTNENEQLKIRFNEERERALKFGRDIDTLTVQNKQLQARNDRQAKRLAELYELMAKKDWESLTEIIDDFCSCEEQLQREWGTYGDVE